MYSKLAMGSILFSDLTEWLMKRTQLNITIDPELLKKIKESARISGKSLTAFVSDFFTNKIEELSSESVDSRIRKIEERLNSLERNLSSLLSRNQKITPFSPEEATNCNEFIKAIFREEIERKQSLNFAKMSRLI